MPYNNKNESYPALQKNSDKEGWMLMKTLLVYDSLYGNTKQIAETVRDAIGKKDVKFLKADSASKSDLDGVDFLIVGSPVHGGMPSQKMKKFLNILAGSKIRLKYGAAFDTGVPTEGQKPFGKFIITLFGYAAKYMANRLRRRGAEILGAETFFVLDKEGPLKNGELERATRWARDIMKKAT